MRIGDVAPDFTLADQQGIARSLAEFRGRWVVLYFYPKDDTPGCTAEACQFRDDYPGVKSLGAEVIGVSVDNHHSHAKFARKYRLPFPLLADADGRVAKLYGSLWDLWLLRFARRHTFLVDPQGKVAKIYRHVSPRSHSREIIADLRALQQAAPR
ncbi:MAG: peroxiredoxin [Gammaproteobacteria bacterium]|nr:peroxiredoxin [Gammaproteobacteria bacterium]